MIVGCWSPKGGSGVSVLAASTALVAARGTETLLIDTTGAAPAVLGLGAADAPGLTDLLQAPELPADALDRIVVAAAPGLGLVTHGRSGVPLSRSGVPLSPSGDVRVRGHELVARWRRQAGTTVVDLGRIDELAGALVDALDAIVVVLRPCYLALRAALDDPRTARSAGIVVVDEPSRALGARDISAVLGLRVIATVPVRPAIARAVDAGTLTARVPETLARASSSLLDGLAGHDVRATFPSRAA